MTPARTVVRTRPDDVAADTWLAGVLDHAAAEHARWQALNPGLAGPDLPIVRIPITLQDPSRPGVVMVAPGCPAWRALARATLDPLPAHAASTRASTRVHTRADLRVSSHPWPGVVLIDASVRMRSTARVAVPSVHTWIALASGVPAGCAGVVLDTYAGLAGYYDNEYAQLAAALALAR